MRKILMHVMLLMAYDKRTRNVHTNFTLLYFVVLQNNRLMCFPLCQCSYIHYIQLTEHGTYAFETFLAIDHYNDVIMGTIAFQIISLTIVYSTVYSDADHQSSASLAFVRVIHPGLVISPHKWPVTRKMFPFDDVIMYHEYLLKKFHGVSTVHIYNETHGEWHSAFLSWHSKSLEIS